MLREDPEGMDLEAKKRPAKAASFAPVKGDDTKGKLSDMLVARVSLDFKALYHHILISIKYSLT